MIERNLTYNRLDFESITFKVKKSEAGPDEISFVIKGQAPFAPLSEVALDNGVLSGDMQAVTIDLSRIDRILLISRNDQRAKLPLEPETPAVEKIAESASPQKKSKGKK